MGRPNRQIVCHSRFHLAKNARAHEIVRTRMLPLYKDNLQIAAQLGLSETSAGNLVCGTKVGPKVLKAVFEWEEKNPLPKENVA